MTAMVVLVTLMLTGDVTWQVRDERRNPMAPEDLGPSWQLTIDAHDPHAQAEFWAAALGGELEDNSELVAAVLQQGWAQESDTLIHHGRRYWADLVAVRGVGPRLLFQRVPEAKTVKNRLHLDLHVGEERIRPEVQRLVALGAVEGKEWREVGGHWIAMTDPEGNEFDVE